MARRLGAVDIWQKRFINSPAKLPSSSYVNWRAMEEAGRPKPIVKAPVVRPTPTTVRPVRPVSAYDSLLSSLAAEEGSAMSRLRGTWGPFAQELSASLGALAAPIGGIYDRAEASGRATEEAIAKRLDTSGAAAQEGLGAKLAQINAPGTAPADLGGIYKGAAGAGYASGMSEVERLNAEGAAAELFANKLPAIGLLEGARIMDQRSRELQEKFSGRRQDLLYQQGRDEREDRLRKEDLEIEERRRREDRLYEQKKDRDARRAREKEFMLTLMADATEAQRRLAEKRLEREWKEEDKRLQRQHDIEMESIRLGNRVATEAMSREDQQAYQAQQNSLARAEQEAERKTRATGWVHVVRNGRVVKTNQRTQRTNQDKTSVAQWQVKQAQDSVFRVNNSGQIVWDANLRRRLQASPKAADGILNGAINTQLRGAGIDPFSKQGTAIRRGILKKISGKMIPGVGRYVYRG